MGGVLASARHRRQRAPHQQRQQAEGQDAEGLMDEARPQGRGVDHDVPAERDLERKQREQRVGERAMGGMRTQA
jgi:hypothetical protein